MNNNIRTFNEFINESSNHTKQNKKFESDESVYPLLINQNITKDYIILMNKIVELERESEMNDNELGEWYKGSNKTVGEIREKVYSDRDDAYKKRDKLISSASSKYPYLQKTIDLLDAYSLDLNNTYIAKVGPKKSFVTLNNWQATAKIRKKEAESYDLSIEEVLAVVVSFSNAAELYGTTDFM